MDDSQYIAHRRENDKEIQFLREHLNETADLAGSFAAKIGLEMQGRLIGLLHDIGKASKEFKQYIEAATKMMDLDVDDFIDVKEKKGKIDHSSAGAQFVYQNFSKNGVELLIAQMLAQAIASHHSGLNDCISSNGDDKFTQRINKDDKQTHLSEVISNLEDSILIEAKELCQDRKMITSFVAKMNELREMNRNQENIRIDCFKLGLLQKFLFSCLIDGDRLSTADFEYPQGKELRNYGRYVSWDLLIECLERRIGDFRCLNDVDVLRKDISIECRQFADKQKGIYQLTVPTGGGKTFSSLRFALHHARRHKMDRVIYVIPYTSIIEQNAQTVKEVLRDQRDEKYLEYVVLEHHSNLTPENESARQKLLSENWDAAVVFTTMVQFLETLFGYGTRSIRRMHQLANAVIIFDEIQTLPIKCVHLFNGAIRFLVNGCGATAVLCTATQPLLDKVDPPERSLPIRAEHQIISNPKKLFAALKRVNVYDIRKKEGWAEEELANFMSKKLEERQSILVIVNTKKSAQELYQQLGNMQAKCYHLSTNMCPKHRLDKLDEMKRLLDQEPVVCVSTQLIEAGVDIDFEIVIRYTAGLDSIAQAAGRCNRNGRRAQLGEVFIVNPQEENLDKLKDIKIGKEITERILEEYKSDPVQFDYDVIGLKAIDRYYKYYFYDRSSIMNYPIQSNSIVGREVRYTRFAGHR